MKYSLKDHYRHILKENTPDPVINSKNDLVKIEFPGDSPSLARYYNLKNAESKKNQDRIYVTKDYELDLGILGTVSKGLTTIPKKVSLNSLKSATGLNTSLRNFFIKVATDFINNSITCELINLKGTADEFKIKDKISEIGEDEFVIYVKQKIPLYQSLQNNKMFNFTSQQSSVDSNKNIIVLNKREENIRNFLISHNTFNLDTSKYDKVFGEIINNLVSPGGSSYIYSSRKAVKQGRSVGDDQFQIQYNLESFVDFSYDSKNKSDVNICFRKYLSDNGIRNNNEKIRIIDFLNESNFFTLKKMFKMAKESMIHFIDFKINSNKEDFLEEDFVLTQISTKDVLLAILYEYCDNITSTTFIQDMRESNLDVNSVRKDFSNIKDAISYLNSLPDSFNKYEGKGGKQGSSKGRGEFHVHAFLNTINACSGIEPDAIIKIGNNEIACSIKNFNTPSSTAQTGTNLESKIDKGYKDFVVSFFKGDIGYKLNAATIFNVSNDKSGYDFPDSTFENLSFVNKDENGNFIVDENKRSNALDKYKEFKSLIGLEHDADAVISYHTHSSDSKFSYADKEMLKDLLTFATMPKNKRISFSIVKDINSYNDRQRVDKLILMLLQDDMSYAGHSGNFSLKDTLDKLNKANNNSQQTTSSTINAGFKIKTRNSNFITEGGKAGHMMHPYENLHMKISDMKRMIEDFQNDFEISEKVDGANLFFTIDPQQGKILFSRNKSDMSHEETLEKFGPDHPAHVLFTDGANAIFNSVKSSLSKQDIQRVFGQSPEGGKTYINFEIMHPQKPNQIKYDMKYIVFHAIVDYDINGSVVESSPDDERLIHLLNQLQPSFNVANNDFSLGSNLKIKLNNLSQSDVDELLNELNNVTSSLGLNDDMTIADAIKSEIRSLLDRENITELLPEDKIEMIYDFITNESTEVKGTAIKKGLDKDLQKTLTSLGLTSKAKAQKIIKQVIQEFRPLFILLGIKLLDNVQSRYMSSDASNKNVDELRRLLDAAMEDYDSMMQAEDLSDAESKIFKTLTPHIANVRHHGAERVVSSPVEGGVFIGKDGNTYKVTGGFAPLNQILGTAMRSLDYMPAFKEEFVAQERGS